MRGGSVHAGALHTSAQMACNFLHKIAGGEGIGGRGRHNSG